MRKYIILLLPLSLLGDWVFKASLNVPRAGLVCEVVQGKIYAIGGRCEHGCLTGVCEEYNPEFDTWLIKQPMPTPRYGAVSGVVGNKIFVIGGDTNTNINEPSATNIIEAYDPILDTWERVNSVWPSPRSGAASATIGNWIYIMGGEIRRPHPMFTDSVEAYNPVLNQWVIKRSMHTPRANFASVAIGNKVYALGGRFGGPLRTCEVYDTLTNTWDSIRSMPRSRVYFAGVPFGERIFVLGGLEGQQGFLSRRVDYYEPDTWVRYDSLNLARYRLGAVIIGNNIYAIGGKDNMGNYFGTVERNTFLSIEEDDSLAASIPNKTIDGPTFISARNISAYLGRLKAGWQLFDITGKAVKSNILSQGIYFIIIKRGDENRVKRIIVY